MSYFGQYFFSGLLFLLVAFVQGFFPRFKNIPVFVTALILVLFAEANSVDWFSAGTYVENEQGYPKRIHFFNIETYYIYIIYNSLLCVTSFIETVKKDVDT